MKHCTTHTVHIEVQRLLNWKKKVRRRHTETERRGVCIITVCIVGPLMYLCQGYFNVHLSSLCWCSSSLHLHASFKTFRFYLTNPCTFVCTVCSVTASNLIQTPHDCYLTASTCTWPNITPKHYCTHTVLRDCLPRAKVFSNCWRNTRGLKVALFLGPLWLQFVVAVLQYAYCKQPKTRRPGNEANKHTCWCWRHSELHYAPINGMSPTLHTWGGC